MLFDVLAQDSRQALTQRRKRNGVEETEMDKKKKGGGMHVPPKLDKWCHLSQCAHTRLCRSKI